MELHLPKFAQFWIVCQTDPSNAYISDELLLDVAEQYKAPAP
jgi:hypothetical protein